MPVASDAVADEHAEPSTPDPAPAAPTSSSASSPPKTVAQRADLLYGFVVGLLYVVAVGVQVYMVVDEVTHGELTADVKRRWHTLTASLADRRRLDRLVRERAPWIQWEAHELLERAAREEGGTT